MEISWKVGVVRLSELVRVSWYWIYRCPSAIQEEEAAERSAPSVTAEQEAKAVAPDMVELFDDRALTETDVLAGVVAWKVSIPQSLACWVSKIDEVRVLVGA